MRIDMSNIHPTMVLALSPFLRPARDYSEIKSARDEATDTIVDMAESDRDLSLERGDR
jgi:hypothetical protein